MRTKVFLTAFGLIVAGITGATSIAAATHPERVAEFQRFAFGGSIHEQDDVTDLSSDTTTSADLESTRPSVDSQRDGERAEAARGTSGGTLREDSDKNRSHEREDEDDDDDDDDRAGSTQVTTPPTNPVSTPTPSTSATKTFTMAQVSTHHTASDCYTAINGVVYDLSPFIASHPGGVSAISQLCGIDGAALFQAQHGGQGKPEQELASLKIGVLAK